LLAAHAKLRPRQSGEPRRADCLFAVPANPIGAFLNAPQRAACFPTLCEYNLKIPGGGFARGRLQPAIEIIGASLDDKGIALPRRTVQFNHPGL
jgi:hypothetical protein